MSKGKNTVPHNERKTGAKARKKLIRRQEAEARETAYNALTAEEQAIQRENNRKRYQENTRS